MRRRTVLSLGPLAAAGLLVGCSATTPTGSSVPATSSTPSLTVPPPAASARPTYDVRTHELTFTSDGNRIYGRLLLPDAPGRKPTVLVSHGLGGTHEQEPRLQELVATHGVVVLGIDFAGGSAGSRGRSEGRTTDMSVLTELQNLKDALAQARQLADVDPSRVTLLGTSQGGVVATLLADELPDAVRSMVLVCPAYVIFDEARRRYPSASAIPETFTLGSMTLGRRYFADVYGMDVYERMGRFQGPVLIFHGTADEVVPYAYSERAAATLAHAGLTPLVGEGHNLTVPAQELVAAATERLVLD